MHLIFFFPGKKSLTGHCVSLVWFGSFTWIHD